MGFGFRVSGFGIRVSGFGIRVSGFETRVSGFGFQVSVFCFRVSGYGFRFSGFRVSGFGFRVSGSRFRFSVFGFRLSGYGFRGFGFRVSWFRVSGSGFRVSGSGFRVSCFGFQVLGFVLRVSGLERTLRSLGQKDVCHTAEHDPFIISQLAPTQSTLGPYVVQIWSRNMPELRGADYFIELCSGSQAGSNLRLIDFVYHSTLGLRVIKRGRETLRSFGAVRVEGRERLVHVVVVIRHLPISKINTHKIE